MLKYVMEYVMPVLYVFTASCFIAITRIKIAEIRKSSKTYEQNNSAQNPERVIIWTLITTLTLSILETILLQFVSLLYVLLITSSSVLFGGIPTAIYLTRKRVK
jgi:hypothetical protein